MLTSAYVKIFRIVTRNAVNKSFWRKKDCSWPPLNKYAMNIWLSSLKIRAHLSWRTGKHLHVLHVLRTCSTCSCPGQQDTTTYAALVMEITRPRTCNGNYTPRDLYCTPWESCGEGAYRNLLFYCRGVLTVLKSIHPRRGKKNDHVHCSPSILLEDGCMTWSYEPALLLQHQGSS